jgi:hypothetical protein
LKLPVLSPRRQENNKYYLYRTINPPFTLLNHCQCFRSLGVLGVLAKATINLHTSTNAIEELKNNHYEQLTPLHDGASNRYCELQINKSGLSSLRGIKEWSSYA